MVVVRMILCSCSPVKVGQCDKVQQSCRLYRPIYMDLTHLVALRVSLFTTPGMHCVFARTHKEHGR